MKSADSFRTTRAVVLLLAALGSACGTGTPAEQPLSPGHTPGHTMMGGEVREKTLDRLPAFVFKDLAGSEVSSEQFRGKVLLVDVWATWCPPCKQEMPWFQDLYDVYRERGLEVIGISIDVNPKDAARFAQELGVSYTMLHRPEIMQEWGLLGLPTTFIVDRDGAVRRKVVGFEYKEAFEVAVKELL